MSAATVSTVRMYPSPVLFSMSLTFQKGLNSELPVSYISRLFKSDVGPSCQQLIPMIIRPTAWLCRGEGGGVERRHLSSPIHNSS